MANEWVRQIFESNQANAGGIVRRKVTSVLKYASQDQLLYEVKRRGFHLIRIGDQYLIFCNPGKIDIIC